MEDENKVVAEENEVKEPEAEAPAAEAEKTEEVSDQDAARQAAIDEMEKASQKALDAMREAGNKPNEEIVDEAEEKVDDLFAQFRAWMEENVKPEDVKAKVETLAKDVSHVLGSTRAKVEEVAQSEQFKKTVESGKDFLVNTGTMIGDGFKYGYDKLMEIPEVKQAAGKVEEGVDKLRENDKLREFVDHTEKGLSDLNAMIFSGLKSFFKTPEEKEQPKEEADKTVLPDIPEDAAK